MKYSLFIPLLVLTGCYQVVNNYDLKDAEKLCSPNDGIAAISANFLGDEKVICNNSTKFFLHKK